MKETLFTPPPADGNLTERQALVLRAAREQGGLRDVDAGSLLHRSKHAGDDYCAFCRMDGLRVLTALRTRGLLVRRKSGLWEPKGAHAGSEGGYDPATAAFPEGF